MQILTDIDTILCYSDQDGIGSELRREGIDTILMCGRGAIELPPGSLRTLHQRLNILLGKNGSATPTDRIKIRCIGALGLVRRRYGNIQLEGELRDVCNWLFGVAASSAEDISHLVSKRADFILISDRLQKQ